MSTNDLIAGLPGEALVREGLPIARPDAAPLPRA